MTINANIQAAKTKLENNEQPFSDDLKELALRAIDGGVAEWIAYMRVFASPEKPQQLARLIPTDGSHALGEMQNARAYLIAAATCTPDTVKHFDEGVTAILDEDLEP